MNEEMELGPRTISITDSEMGTAQGTIFWNKLGQSEVNFTVNAKHNYTRLLFDVFVKLLYDQAIKQEMLKRERAGMT